jgi:hypothetical protein
VLLTDWKFHNLGIGYRTGRFADPGRFAVSRLERDLGAFRTPSLRTVARTAPYMHDGSLATLEDVPATSLAENPATSLNLTHLRATLRGCQHKQNGPSKIQRIPPSSALWVSSFAVSLSAEFATTMTAHGSS